jgi:hypothetical protein
MGNNENAICYPSLVEALGFLSYRIQATDVTLFPSAAH